MSFNENTSFNENMKKSQKKITLIYLINYVPNNDIERMMYKDIDIQVLSSYLQDTKLQYLGGSFYLGGQVKMQPDEEITIQKIDEVREISKQRLKDYGYTNSFELGSITRSEKLLNELEKIIKFHLNLLS